ncbi:hypothetical protein A2U01_0094694, partial [Trifolium medium]|nr:hypothetical protein [Trifolium medium]
MWLPGWIVVLWSGVANSICHINLLVLYICLSLVEELVQ